MVRGRKQVNRMPYVIARTTQDLGHHPTTTTTTYSYSYYDSLPPPSIHPLHPSYSHQTSFIRKHNQSISPLVFPSGHFPLSAPLPSYYCLHCCAPSLSFNSFHWWALDRPLRE